jgi:hypothetical protein
MRERRWLCFFSRKQFTEVHVQTTQGTMLATLEAIQDFIDKYKDLLGDLATNGSRRQLDDVINQLTAFAATQDKSVVTGKAGTKQAKALRTALERDHMLKISRIAAVDLPVKPELSALHMPKGKPTVAKLVAAARSMATTAQLYAATFVAAGMHADFIAQLNAAADAVADFESARKQNHAERGTATTGLKYLLAAGNRVVGAIDAFMKSALKDNPPLLEGWAQVKKSRKPAAKPSTPPAPVPIPGAPPVQPGSATTAAAPATPPATQ